MMSVGSGVGDGFKMVLSVPDVDSDSARSQQRREVEALMLGLSADAKLVTAFGRQLTYTLPLESSDVSRIFNTMEEQKRQRTVMEWGLSQASLEEVFMKVRTTPPATDSGGGGGGGGAGAAAAAAAAAAAVVTIA
jgi:hypothetical protein